MKPSLTCCEPRLIALTHKTIWIHMCDRKRGLKVDARLLKGDDLDDAARQEFGGDPTVGYVSPICKHGFKDWTECPTCTAAADFDDG